MQMKTKVAGSILTVLSVAIIAAFLIGKTEREAYPILGTEMLTTVSVVENHREALRIWSTKGIKDAVLVNIDAHDDLRPIPQQEMEQLKDLHKGKQEGDAGDVVCQEGYGPVTNANFIHAAAKLGIVRKVVWVVPSSYGIFSDQGKRLRSLLTAYGFTASEIAGFKNNGRFFTGESDGIPLTICDATSLPEIKEPVLLSIDVDFFPSEITDDTHRISSPMKKTFKSLFTKGYRVKDAVVAHSVSGGFTEASYRWIGELVVDTIRLPGVMQLPDLPDRYAFLQKADHLLIFKKYRALLDILTPITAKGINDPALSTYTALACQGLGKTDEAFKWAEKACLADKGYCFALTQVGSLVLEQFGLEKAEPFFKRGYELSPGMDEGQFRFAMALKRSGRYDEAIRYFNAFRNSYGPFPVDFYIAETFLLKGDENSAIRYYDSGRKELARNPSALTGFGDVRAIEEAAAFYERKGNSRVAMELRNSVKSLGSTEFGS